MSTTLWARGEPPPETSTSNRVVLACVGIVFAGIVALFGVWYLNPAHMIAEWVTAAHLPYVELVDYHLNPIYPANSVEIYLTADVTDAQVVDLYCRIVTPGAAAAVKSPSDFGMIKGVTWAGPSPLRPEDRGHYGYSGGTTVDPPTCP